VYDRDAVELIDALAPWSSKRDWDVIGVTQKSELDQALTSHVQGVFLYDQSLAIEGASFSGKLEKFACEEMATDGDQDSTTIVKPISIPNLVNHIDRIASQLKDHVAL
ncbi:MAG: hypothetical protein F6K62_27070, partial [Sphaerospermopsis sp. SIO1G2]|nr:hypothetical protein [Sphaerospermopsis sp. SIO1G2]